MSSCLLRLDVVFLFGASRCCLLVCCF